MNLGMSVAASVSLSIKWGWSPLPPVVDVGVTGQNAHELFCIVVWHMVGKNLKDFKNDNKRFIIIVKELTASEGRQSHGNISG